jgi:hypothetical protein
MSRDNSATAHRDLRSPVVIAAEVALVGSAAMSALSRSTASAPPVTPARHRGCCPPAGGRVRVTPVISMSADPISTCRSTSLLKLELLQHVGSFKPRGAFNRVLAAAHVPSAGLVAASGGNHGAALAFVAALTGVPCGRVRAIHQPGR